MNNKKDKKQKWTDKKIQKLFEKEFLSKIHSSEFNFGCQMSCFDARQVYGGSGGCDCGIQVGIATSDCAKFPGRG